MFLPQQLNGTAYSAPLLNRYAQPDLIDLMSLFIGWGLSIQKGKWLDRAPATVKRDQAFVL